MSNFISNLDDSNAAVPKHLLDEFLAVAEQLIGEYEMPTDELEEMCERLRSNAKPE